MLVYPKRNDTCYLEMAQELNGQYETLANHTTDITY